MARRPVERHAGAARAARADLIPDARDGLTRVERVVLWVLSETQKELGGRGVPTAMLYGRVVDHVDLSVDELQRILQRLAGRGLPQPLDRGR